MSPKGSCMLSFIVFKMYSFLVFFPQKVMMYVEFDITGLMAESPTKAYLKN